MANPFIRASVAGGGGTGSVATSPAQGGLSFTQAQSEIRAGMSGRISLAMLDLIILSMIGFYIWTRNAQGGS